MPLAGGASNCAEDHQLGSISLHYSKGSDYFYSVLIRLKEAITMFTKIYHNDAYRCLDTFTLEFWLKRSSWHVLPRSYGKCCHMKRTPARLAPYVQNHFSITFLEICIWELSKIIDLYCEMTYHGMRKVRFKSFLKIQLSENEILTSDWNLRKN